MDTRLELARHVVVTRGEHGKTHDQDAGFGRPERLSEVTRREDFREEHYDQSCSPGGAQGAEDRGSRIPGGS